MGKLGFAKLIQMSPGTLDIDLRRQTTPNLR